MGIFMKIRLIHYKDAYLSDNFNRIEFLILISGIINYLYTEVGSFILLR